MSRRKWDNKKKATDIFPNVEPECAEGLVWSHFVAGGRREAAKILKSEISSKSLINFFITLFLVFAFGSLEELLILPKNTSYMHWEASHAFNYHHLLSSGCHSVIQSVSQSVETERET